MAKSKRESAWRMIRVPVDVAEMLKAERDLWDSAYQNNRTTDLPVYDHTGKIAVWRVIVRLINFKRDHRTRSKKHGKTTRKVIS